MLITTGDAAAQQGRIVVDLPLPPAPSEAGAGLVAVSAPPPAPAAAAPAKPVVTRDAAGPELPHSSVAEPGLREVEMHVAKGDSLYSLFERHGLSQADLAMMLRGDRRVRRALRRLSPGQRIHALATDAGEVRRLTLALDGPNGLRATRGVGGAFEWTRFEDPLPVTPAQPADRVAVTEAPAPPPVIEAPTLQTTIDVTVRRGDSLFLIFRRLDLPPADLALLLEANDDAHALRRLRPGQRLELSRGSDGRLWGLRAVLDETRSLVASRVGDGFRVAIEQVPLERRTAHASAVIESSLFLAGQRAGLPDRLIMGLVEIFGWDVDFALDVRGGDRFIVVYEQLYKDGRKVRDGDILAAEFVNRGRTLRAVRYSYDDGRAEYFSPDGLSMRKAFLRTPVTFGRISSRFSRGRMHPVLQRMRAHKGVDYAAPTGTPVKAAGDGRVISAGRKGGYGKTVVLQHGGAYTTLYAHLSRIHRRARSGRRVQQGDIIGYVGATGLATGPHLHYEFRVRGVHKDPLRVKLPKALPIAAKLKQDFLRVSSPLVAQLDTLARTSLASSD
jgi:murein DD-endopeptidase MepM/ murein hydrolase activator NlpD